MDSVPQKVKYVLVISIYIIYNALRIDLAPYGGRIVRKEVINYAQV